MAKVSWLVHRGLTSLLVVAISVLLLINIFTLRKLYVLINLGNLIDIISTNIPRSVFGHKIDLDSKAIQTPKIATLSHPGLLGESIITDIPQPGPSNTSVPQSAPWAFNPVQDSRRFGLSTSQCTGAFPGLFKEIERAILYRQTVGIITKDDIDISWKTNGAVRGAIVDQQVMF